MSKRRVCTAWYHSGTDHEYRCSLVWRVSMPTTNVKSVCRTIFDAVRADLSFSSCISYILVGSSPPKRHNPHLRRIQQNGSDLKEAYMLCSKVYPDAWVYDHIHSTRELTYTILHPRHILPVLSHQQLAFITPNLMWHHALLLHYSLYFRHLVCSPEVVYFDLPETPHSSQPSIYNPDLP